MVLATLVTMASTMRGGDGGSGAMASAEALELAAPLVSGTPARQVLAQRDSVVLYVPIAQGAITGIAYHPVEGSSADLARSRRRAAERRPRAPGAAQPLRRELERPQVLGGRGLDAGRRRRRPAGTDVYSPVAGEVVAITPTVINGGRYGSTIAIQPTGNPSLVVNVSHVEIPRQADGDPAVRVGDSMLPGKTPLGTVVDLSGVVDLGLGRFVSDAGNNASITVEPAPQLVIP